MKEFLQRKKSIDLSVKFIELNDNLQAYRVDELLDLKLIAQKCKSQVEQLLAYASANKRYVVDYLSYVNAIFEAEKTAIYALDEICIFETEWLGMRECNTMNE